MIQTTGCAGYKMGFLIIGSKRPEQKLSGIIPKLTIADISLLRCSGNVVLTASFKCSGNMPSIPQAVFPFNFLINRMMVCLDIETHSSMFFRFSYC